jgi:hypothetical protein
MTKYGGVRWMNHDNFLSFLSFLSELFLPKHEAGLYHPTVKSYADLSRSHRPEVTVGIYAMPLIKMGDSAKNDYEMLYY